MRWGEERREVADVFRPEGERRLEERRGEERPGGTLAHPPPPQSANTRISQSPGGWSGARRAGVAGPGYQHLSILSPGQPWCQYSVSVSQLNN